MEGRQKRSREEDSEEPCKPTVSICVPDSILSNAQSFELRTYLVGQIARAAAIYNIEEIVVLKDAHSSKDSQRKLDYTAFFIRNLEYVVRDRQETPQYLRKTLFPMHPDLKYSGLLNPLDTPHHLRADEWSKYREGVTVERPMKAEAGSWVNIGLRSVRTTQDIQVDMKLLPRTRVTVQLRKDDKDSRRHAGLKGKIVSAGKPRRHRYWGYTTRIAESITAALSQGPYEEGYDLLLGTSDRGEPLPSSLPSARHALLVFGGLAGLEDILDSDESTTLKDPCQLFHYYLNLCPSQGTRTIRTEEAVLIALATLSPLLGR